MHVASLHDGDERSALLGLQHVITNRPLRTLFFVRIDDGKAHVIHQPLLQRPLSFNELIDIISDSMELLGANDKVNMPNFFHQFFTPTLRHAAEESEDHFRLVCAKPSQHAHLAQRLLLRHVPYTAGV